MSQGYLSIKFKIHSSKQNVYGGYIWKFQGNWICPHFFTSWWAKRKNLEVKVFGGGKIIPALTDVGIKNINFVLSYIDQEGLRLLSQDLGDIYPRKIIYFPKTGRVAMKKIQDLHNDTIAQRERQYFNSLKNAPVEGEVELFWSLWRA